MASIVVAGDTSGTVTLAAPAVSGTTTLTLPTTSGTLITTGGGAAGSFTTLTSTQDASFATSSGNVGIGTTSPTTYGDSNTKLAVYKATSGNTYINTFVGTDNVKYATYVNDASGDTIVKTGTSTNHAYAFLTNGTERMRIDSSGRAGIAKSSNLTGQLNVSNGQGFNNGTGGLPLAAVVLDGNYGGGLSFIDGSQGYSLWSQTAGADFYIRRATTTGAFTGGVFINNAATSWSAASDENVKDIIEPIKNAIEKVSTLRTVIGKYKDEEEGIRHPFLIAQDVEKVLPEAISVMNKGSENECLGLSYTDTIPLLVAAIKEQQTIIETLKADIAELKAKVK